MAVAEPRLAATPTALGVARLAAAASARGTPSCCVDALALLARAEVARVPREVHPAVEKKLKLDDEFVIFESLLWE